MWKTGLVVGVAMCSVAMATTMEDQIEKAKPAAEASNAFAGDLYGALRTQEGNLFFSPASVSIGLAMGEAGARGDTEAQMAKTLHLPPNDPAIHEAFGALVWLLTQPGSDCGLRAVNSMWAQRDYPFCDSYMHIVRDIYGAQAHKADFIQAADSACEIINAWTATQTNFRICDLIPPGLLDSRTRMVLVNAMYFKARWTFKFLEKNTKDAPFHLTSEQTVQAPMMHQRGMYRYGENETMQFLEKTYVSGSMAMMILLPRAVDGLPAIERQFSAKALQDWLSQSQDEDAEVAIPRFRMESSFSLKDTLSALGMPLAFSGGAADFTGMTDKEKALYLSFVLHRAFVDVNEEGTEATAATGFGYMGGGELTEGPPKQFNADHPFLFVIRETYTGTILFVGRVMNPAQ